MFELEMLARVLPSLIEVTIFTSLLYSISNTKKNLAVGLVNSIVLMMVMFWFAPQLGAALLMLVIFINGHLVFGIKRVECLNILVIMLLVSLVTQSTILLVYTSLFSFNNVLVIIPSMMSVALEFAILKYIIKRRKFMTIMFWVGKKEKTTYKQYKEAKKTKK